MNDRKPNTRLGFGCTASFRGLLTATMIVLLATQGCSLSQFAVGQVDAIAANPDGSIEPASISPIDPIEQTGETFNDRLQTQSNPTSNDSDVEAFKAAMGAAESNLNDETDSITEEFKKSTFSPNWDPDQAFRDNVRQATYQESVGSEQTAAFQETVVQEAFEGGSPGRPNANQASQNSGAMLGGTIVPLQDPNTAVPDILSQPTIASPRTQGMIQSHPQGQYLQNQLRQPNQPIEQGAPFHGAPNYPTQETMHPHHMLPTRPGYQRSQATHQLTDQYPNQQTVINSAGTGYSTQYMDPMGFQPSDRGLLNMVGSEYRQPMATASEVMIAQREKMVQLQSEVGTLRTDLINERARFSEEQAMRRNAEMSLAKTQDENTRLRAMVARLQVQVEQIEKVRQDQEISFNTKLREIETSLDAAVLQTLESIPKAGKPKR